MKKKEVSSTGCTMAIFVSLILLVAGNYAYKSNVPKHTNQDSLVVKPDSIKIRIGKDSFIIKILKYERTIKTD